MPVPISARTLIHSFFIASALAALPRPADRATPRSGTFGGSVMAIAPMSIERAAHTATTLPDGRVLIAGGFAVESRAGLSAELFDPAAGRFSPLPRMVVPRHSHTATMLPNGKILIAGGYGSGSAIVSSAELFDPATNTFVSTGSMIARRAGHVAVLLSNGKVLLAGGVGPGWSFLASAELYDPATGTFTRTGAMTVPRESHVAVLLQDGRALVIGGHRDRRENIVLYTSTETYDAATGTFRRAADMTMRRHKHDAVLLRDGRVLVTGGSDERDENGAYSSTEFFEPASGRFVVGPSMVHTRYKHQGTAVMLPNGNVLVAGGSARAELFDARSQMFTTLDGDARLAGLFGAASRFGTGNVLITGGYGNGAGPRASAWVYRP